MIKYKLSNLQRSYLTGRSIQNRLGGVPCHVYIEAGGKCIDFHRLCSAWKKVLDRHPLLRCRVEGLEYLEEIVQSPNEHINFFDFSSFTPREAETERKKIREEFSQRMLRTEYGHTCGLSLIKLPEGGDILAFDFDLTAGDVYSFQVILSDLAGFYSGNPDNSVVMPYSVGRRADNAQSPGREENDVFRMPLAADPDQLYGCKYRSIRFSYPRNFWTDIAKKLFEKCSGEDVWKAVSALTVHKISGMTSFLMNVPHFRSDMKSVCENTELYLIRSQHIGGERFGDFMSRLVFETLKWQDGKYTDGFGLHMRMLRTQKETDAGGWVAPVVFSSAGGIMLLTEQFEKNFGKLVYMVSQTPQVWADFQLFELPDSTEVYWMIPEGLFEESTLEEMARIFRDIAGRLGSSQTPSDEVV